MTTAAAKLEPSLLARAARWYAAHGYAVFQLTPGEKIPLKGSAAFKDATTDKDKITQWGQANPDANIGMATGAQTGIWVLDIDAHQGGENTLEALEAKHGKLPDTVQTLTPHGWHLWFTWPRNGTVYNSAGKVGAGIDVRGAGGYVVVPPSRLRANGRVYEFEGSSELTKVKIAEAPKWLIKLVCEEKHKPPNTDGEVIRRGTRNDTLTKMAGAMRRQGMTPTEIEAALKNVNNSRCTPPLTDKEVTRIAHSIGRYPPAEPENEWPDPTPLPEGLPPVRELDPAAIPEPLRGWIMDVSERMQVPPDFAAATTIVAAGAVIGRRVGILPKERDDWLAIPNLWGGIVSRSGLLKTPAIEEAMRPLNKLEALAIEKHQKEMEAYVVDVEIAQGKRAAWKEEIKTAAKAKNEDELNDLRGTPPVQPERPTARRHKTADPTVEKLGELLRENTNGLLVYRDELTGWLRSLDKQGREGDRAFYLEAWNGTGSYTVDRIGRGTLHIPALCVSVFGGIQPGPISDYVYHATQGGIGDDGLLQRFQVLVWPDPPSRWKNIDRWPNSAAKERVYLIFERLDQLSPETFGASEADIPALHFSPEAQEFFNQWRAELEVRLMSGELPPALESHLGKYRSLMPSLALIFYLVGAVEHGQHGPVDAEAALQAAVWCEYLESHARRLYSCIANPLMDSARELLKHIRRKELQDGFTARDVYRNCWTRLATPDQANQALKVLADFSWIREQTTHTDGRPKTQYRIHWCLKNERR